MGPLIVAICEDEAAERAQLRAMVEACGETVQVEEYTQGTAFLAAFHPKRFDLLLMDIYLEDVSGVEAVRRVRALDREVPIAFITNSLDHALDGYRLDVAKYIEKPAGQGAVEAMLSLGRAYRERQEGTPVMLGGRQHRLLLERLRYVEQKGHYLHFHLEGEDERQIKGKLDELEPQLASGPFLRCHKSFLANLSYVSELDREQLLFQMRGGGSVYIRREALRQVRLAWEDWLFQAARRRGEDG